MEKQRANHVAGPCSSREELEKRGSFEVGAAMGAQPPIDRVGLCAVAADTSNGDRRPDKHPLHCERPDSAVSPHWGVLLRADNCPDVARTRCGPQQLVGAASPTTRYDRSSGTNLS